MIKEKIAEKIKSYTDATINKQVEEKQKKEKSTGDLKNWHDKEYVPALKSKGKHTLQMASEILLIKMFPKSESGLNSQVNVEYLKQALALVSELHCNIQMASFHRLVCYSLYQEIPNLHTPMCPYGTIAYMRNGKIRMRKKGKPVESQLDHPLTAWNGPTFASECNMFLF